MLQIKHAVLHVCDFESCATVLSKVEMDLTGKNAKHFVNKHVSKALASLDSKHGEFDEESAFAQEVRSYFLGQRDFMELSMQVAEFLSAELGHMEKPESCDVLVVDFEDEPKRASDATTEEEIEAAFEAKGARYFAIMMLESKQAYIHEVGYDDNGLQRNDIKRHHAVLPNPSQKVASYALIESKSLSVLFADKPRKVSGEDRLIIPDGLLQCSMHESTKDTIQAVTRIVEEVAEEFGANTAVAMSKAKAYVSESVDEMDDLRPEDLGEAVFEESPQLKQRFEEALVEQAVPESVQVERAVANRVAKNHKIRTDTGIEITFPVEYGTNPEFIEFVSEPNGLISIELKNIGSIENR